MNSFPVLDLVLVVIIVAVSAFFSAGETALFSLDRIQLDRLLNHRGVLSKWIRYLLSRPHRVLVTTIAGNELANILLASLATEVLYETLGPRGLASWTPLVNAVVLTPLLVIFCDITPKVLALSQSVSVAKFLSVPLGFFYWILTPIRIVIMLMVHGILRFLRVPSQRDDPLTEDEFLAIMKQSEQAGHLDPDDKRLIENVFSFSAHTGQEIMTPLSRAFLLDFNEPVVDAIAKVQESRYSKIPVYKGEEAHVVGVIYVRDLLRARIQNPELLKDFRVKDIMRPVIYVGAPWPINRILKEMKKSRRQIVLVRTSQAERDRRKEAIGIITVEDVIEELFGKIKDERDMEETT